MSTLHTDPTLREEAPSLRSPRVWLITGLALIMIVAATAMATAQAPVPVRFALSLPLLVGLGGDATVRLLLGRSDRLGDPVFRTGLTVVLGVLILLAAVLVIGVLGQLLTPTRLSLAAGVAAAALTLAATLACPGTVPFAAGPLPSRGPTRSALTVLVGLVVTGALLTGAVAAADSLRPRTSHPSTALEFSEATRYQGKPAEARTGAAVRIGVKLLSYDSELSASSPELDVTVAGSEPKRLEISWLDVQRRGASEDPNAEESERSGTVAFRAPSRPGLYRVLLHTPSPRDGSDLMLTTYLEVRS